MPQYFFRVVGMHDTDDGGEELPDTEAARAFAVQAAREILSEGALDGRDYSDRAMVVTDEAGSTVHTLRIGDTVTK